MIREEVVMKRIFEDFDHFGRCLDPLLMLLYPHPIVNKQEVFTKLSGDHITNDWVSCSITRAWGYPAYQ